MSCACDELVFPPPLVIGAGLPSLPRQIAGFPEFRAALLSAVGDHARFPALASWRARSGDDLGLLLIDAWAYVCDVLAFYDQVLANEGYLGTAQLRPSLRRQVALIGYRPRPAVAASARLALLLEGRRPVAVPSGAAFRSGAFGGEPPQVFETTADSALDPELNAWSIVAPRPAALSGSITTLLLDPATVRIREGGLLLIELGGATTERYVRVAARVQPTTTEDGARAVAVSLDQPLDLATPKPLDQARLSTPTRRTGLWRQPLASDDPAVISTRRFDVAVAAGAFSSGTAAALTATTAAAGFTATGLGAPGTSLLLPALDRQLTDGGDVVIEAGGERRWARIAGHDEPRVTVAPAQSITVAGSAVAIPAVKTPTTRMSVAPILPASGPFHDAAQVTIHLDLVPCGRAIASAAPLLAATDPLRLDGVSPRTVAPPSVRHFLLASADERGVDLTATLDVAGARLVPAPPPDFAPPRELPVTAYGNVVDVSRGETVPIEILGSGDAAQVHQTFTLAKSPLTYLPSPAASDEWGAASTLTVWVDGLRWREVPTFFGAGPDDTVFIIRQTDEGASTVTFGDGIRGARLSSGTDNVVASYRHGGGAASPPAGSIKQLARPVPGVKSVLNPVAADGGSDAEGPEEMRVRAPRSALLLGRAVSMVDFEAAALAVGGVRAASAEWRWNGVSQRPVVHVFYVGGSSLRETISARLRALSDPSTPIVVDLATAAPALLTIDLETDPARQAPAVVSAVRHRLLDAGGLLTVAQLGVGRPLFRSALFRAVMSEPGVRGVRALTWNRHPFVAYGVRPGSGRTFDFETQGLTITGSASHG